MRSTNDKHNQNRRSFKHITIMLFIVTLITWFVLFIYKYKTRDVSSLLDDIMDNLLGILVPIIIFNFIYEYFSKVYVADEMSKQIMSTLTGNAKMMGAFKEKIRRNFIKSTVKSLVGKERFNMVYGTIKPYISGKLMT